MSSSAGKTSGSVGLGAVIATILGLLIIAAVAAASFFFIRYRKTGTQQLKVSQSQVVITRPASMTELPAGSPINVQVSAVGQQPFTSTELWINGVLKGVQAAPPGGLISITAHYSWIPSQSGNYSLVARALTLEGGTAVSNAVFVSILPPEEPFVPEDTTGEITPVVLPAAPAGFSNPLPPASAEISVPGEEWRGSLAEWLIDLVTLVPPAAPELTAVADGCSVKIDIHDLSENEEGFALYRQTTNSQDWVLVKNFASHSGTGWVGYRDANLAGGITYYASAFNSQGEASSNLVLVNIDPETCPQPEPSFDLSTLRLKIENLNLDGQSGNIYCYRSLGDGNWLRWPEQGFITSDGATSDGMEKIIPLLSNPLILSGINGLGTNPVMDLLDLKLECWGWQDGILRSLGNFHEKIDLGERTAVHAGFLGAAFDISPEISSHTKREVFLLGEGIVPNLTRPLDPYSVENLGYIPESDQMPLIHLWVSYDKNDCMSHIQGPFEQEMNCYPLPGFNQGPGGANPQPYLIWDVNDSDCEGSPGKECFSMSWWESFAQQNPDPYNATPLLFKLQSIYLTSEGDVAKFGFGIDKTQQAVRLYPGFPPAGENTCYNGNQIFIVSLVANTSLGEITSPASNFIAVPCPQQLGEVKIEVTFNVMTVDNIDDGVGDSTADNVYGQFAARVNGELGALLRIGWWNGEEPGCEYFGSMCIPSGTNGYIADLNNGSYNLATDILLCNPAVTGSCTSDTQNEFFSNNNKLIITLKDGDSLLLFSELYDYDELSSDDAICNQYVWVGPRTVEQWAAVVNEPYNLIQPEGDATCNLQVILNALNPDQ